KPRGSRIEISHQAPTRAAAMEHQNAAPGVHCACGWRGAHMAACGERAAAGEGLAHRGPLAGNVGPVAALAGISSRLRDVGYVEGQNLAILWKFGGDSVDQLTILAKEIVASKVDVIFAINTSAALAAKHATSTIQVLGSRHSRR